MQGYGKLTYSSLFYLLCHNSQDIEYFNHYLNDDVRRRRGWSNLSRGHQHLRKSPSPVRKPASSLLKLSPKKISPRALPNQPLRQG